MPAASPALQLMAVVLRRHRIFEDEAVAELLTTGKLSELAVLTLYLMCASALGFRPFFSATQLHLPIVSRAPCS